MRRINFEIKNIFNHYNQYEEIKITNVLQIDSDHVSSLNKHIHKHTPHTNNKRKSVSHC